MAVRVEELRSILWFLGSVMLSSRPLLTRHSARELPRELLRRFGRRTDYRYVEVVSLLLLHVQVRRDRVCYRLHVLRIGERYDGSSATPVEYRLGTVLADPSVIGQRRASRDVPGSVPRYVRRVCNAASCGTESERSRNDAN